MIRNSIGGELTKSLTPADELLAPACAARSAKRELHSSFLLGMTYGARIAPSGSRGGRLERLDHTSSTRPLNPDGKTDNNVCN